MCWRFADFWMAVKDDILENFANLLNRELPEELWSAAYAQRDGRDYALAFEALLERLQAEDLILLPGEIECVLGAKAVL